MLKYVRHAVSSVEGALDRVKLAYKWKYNRWDELQITPYRGYGTPERLHLKGRVLDDKGADVDAHHDSLWKSVTNTIRRIESDEIPGAVVRLEFDGRSVEAETDEDGYFDVTLEPSEPLDGDVLWHQIPIELVKPESPDGRDVRAEAEVIVPPDDSEFGVISDLDDTVIRTGATSMLRMVRTVLFNTAHTRSPFPGVGAFYEALTLGPDEKGHNPIFYVSSSPWNYYGMFVTFMEVRELPAGPIFLKDFGFTEDTFFSSGHHEHKLERIDRILNTYPDLSFVLIGDTGQQDAEIYREVVQRHPDRILAIYIRDVTPDGRDREVDAIADDLAEQGVPMIRTEHTRDAAEHAASEGLIPPQWVEKIDREAEEEGE